MRDSDEKTGLNVDFPAYGLLNLWRKQKLRNMIIATLPFKPSRMVKTFRKAYEDQKASYKDNERRAKRSCTIDPNAIEKARMAIRAGKVTVITEFSLLALV